MICLGGPDSLISDFYALVPIGFDFLEVTHFVDCSGLENIPSHNRISLHLSPRAVQRSRATSHPETLTNIGKINIINKLENSEKSLRKKGRPSTLSLLDMDLSLHDEIAPLSFAALDDRDWFLRYRAHLRMLIQKKDARSNLKVLPAMEAHILNRIRELNATPVGRFFEMASDPMQVVPKMRTKGIREDRAIELSKALLQFTRRDPYLARRIILGYCYAASVRMAVSLAGFEDAKFGRMFVRFLKDLTIPRLDYQIFAFRVHNQEPDPTLWLGELQLPPNTQVQIKNARNMNCAAALHHIEIQPGTKRASRELHEVIVLAAVVGLWNCVRPQSARLCKSSLLDPLAPFSLMRV